MIRLYDNETILIYLNGILSFLHSKTEESWETTESWVSLTQATENMIDLVESLNTTSKI